MTNQTQEHIDEGLNFEHLATTLMDTALAQWPIEPVLEWVAMTTWRAAECYVDAYLFEVHSLQLANPQDREQQIRQAPSFRAGFPNALASYGILRWHNDL